MPLSTYEGFVENGQIHLRETVSLPEHTRVYVVIPNLEISPTARVRSPRLVHPEQAADFTKQLVETSDDAEL